MKIQLSTSLWPTSSPAKSFMMINDHDDHDDQDDDDDNDDDDDEEEEDSAFHQLRPPSSPADGQLWVSPASPKKQRSKETQSERSIVAEKHKFKTQRGKETNQRSSVVKKTQS